MPSAKNQIIVVKESKKSNFWTILILIAILLTLITMVSSSAADLVASVINWFRNWLTPEGQPDPEPITGEDVQTYTGLVVLGLVGMLLIKWGVAAIATGIGVTIGSVMVVVGLALVATSIFLGWRSNRSDSLKKRTEG